MNWGIRVRIGGALAVSALVAACAPAPGEIAEIRTQRVVVPSIPLPPARSWHVTASALDAAACMECDRVDPDAPRFFYGRLPLGSVDAIESGRWPAGDSVDTSAALGNVVVSGYFGGIYLRSNLASIGADTPVAESPVGAVLDGIGRLSSQGFDDIASGLLTTADRGTDDEVRSASRSWMAALSAIHGYNRGYLEVALAHPPDGVVIDPATLVCSSTFDCRTASLPLASLDSLSGVVDQLRSPPDNQWLFGSTIIEAIARGSVDGGRGVWDNLLSTAEFAPAAYRSIIELSGGFLEVTQVALLGTAAAALGNDIERGRAGLRASAALLLWAGAYFTGLASPLPDTIQPTLLCSSAG